MFNSTIDPQPIRLVGYIATPTVARNSDVAAFPATQVTHIVCVFGSVSVQGESVLADANDEPSLQQLLTLKRQHPKLTTLISVGGPDRSENFAAAAQSPESRERFAHSCVRLMRHHGLDGIDIAWWWPAEHERRHHAELIGELRRRFDAAGEADQRKYLLTIVGPAEPHRRAAMALDQIHPHVDWINLAAFDFVAATNPVTDFTAPLFPPADDPAPVAARLTHNVDAAVKAYLAADVPADKLVVGVRFAATGWQGVPANASNGLYQTATGPAKGTWDAAGEPPSGRIGYQDIETNYLGSYTRYWHASAQVPWLFNAATGIMVSYEDPQSLAAKAGYVTGNQLGGVAVFDLDADDAQHTLLGAFTGSIVPAPPVVPLAGANLADTVLANLQGGGPAAQYISDTLNTALRNTLAQAATQAGETALANLVQAIPAVDIAAQSGVTMHDFVQQQITMPTDTADRQAVTAAIAKLSTTATIADVLWLDQPLDANPLFAGDAGKASLASLLGTTSAAGANAKLADDFITAYAAFDGSAADFWAALAQNPEFQNAVPELQLTLQLGALTQSNTALVAALRTRVPNMASPQALVALTAADLQQLITSQNIPVPAAITGATAADKAANYAASIIAILKDAYPGAYFAQGLAQTVGSADDVVSRGVAAFLANASDFDFLHSNLTTYLAQNGQAALKGIDATQQPAVAARLATWQRVARVAADFPTASALVTAGFGSAYAIASAPRAAVMQKLTGPLGAIQAQAIYGRAQQIASTTFALYANVRQGLNFPAMNITGNMSGLVVSRLRGEGSQLPNWQTLFGSLSSCACTDCRSAYSAAAYLVDLLQFLKTSGTAAAGPSPYDVLVARRPDLPYIKLNCANTDTELPYVDLVNEILEGFVVINNGTLTPSTGSGLPAGFPAHDTPKDATAAELSVNPLNTLDDAYNKYLVGWVSPPTLPFDRWLLTARTYLNFTGTSLYALMTASQVLPATPFGHDVASPALAPLAGVTAELPPLIAYDALIGALMVTGAMTTSARAKLLGFSTNAGYQTEINNLYQTSQITLAQGTPSPIAVACEYLGISSAECVILTGLDFSGAAPSPPEPPLHQTYEFYGFAAPNPPATWNQQIASVPMFLQALAITYDDLVALLETCALNPKLTILIRANGSDPCDVTQMTIVDLSQNGGTLTTATLDVFHRFVRLWRKLSWAVSDLDKAMTALQALTIDQQVLVELAGMQQLVAATNMPLASVRSFFGTIDTDGRDSLYVSLFQNPVVANPPSPTLALTYAAPLAALPTLEFPSPLFPNLAFAGGTLTLTGSMTDAQYQALSSLSTNSAYANAISTLHAGTQAAAPLMALPAATLPSWLNHDPAAKQISYVGAMTDDQRAQLNFSSDAAYQASIDALYDMRSLFSARLATTSTIADNTPAILAALGISTQDLAALANVAALPLTGSPVSLAELTTLTRYALLAQGLGLSISDLLTASWIALPGGDPFRDQNPAATLAFVNSVQAIQASPFSITQLGYLFLNPYLFPSLSASIGPAPADVALLLATLQNGLAGIARANAVVPDPKGALLAVALAKLLGTDLASAAMGLITGAGVYSAPLAALPAISLPAFVTYNSAAQTLAIAGAMTAAQQAALAALSDDPTYQAAVAALAQASLAGGGTVSLAALPPLPLPAASPAMAYDTAALMLRVTGPLTAAQQALALSLSGDAAYQTAVNSLRQQPIDFINANFVAFLDPAAALAELIDSSPPPIVAQKVTFVATALMPYLTTVQSRSLIKQTLSGNLSLDPQLCDLLLDTILSSQVFASTPANPMYAMADFLALLGDGLSAAYFTNPGLTGTPAATRIDATVEFSWGFAPPPDVPAVAAAPFGVKWTGFVMPQYSEAYTFYAKAGDGMRLFVNGVKLIDSWLDGAPTERWGTTAPLTAGQLYTIELDYYDSTASAGVTLSWMSPSTPKAVIPQTQLFSGTVPAAPQTTPLLQLIANAYVLLFKTSLLVNTFPLSAAEVTYLYANRLSFPGNPAVPVPFDPNVMFDFTQPAPARFNVWQRLDAIVTLRNALPGGSAGLLGILATAVAASPGPAPGPQTPGTLSPPVRAAILAATNWNATDLDFLVSTGGFGLKDIDFTNEAGTAQTGLVRLQACIALTARLGISAQQLFYWSAFGPDLATEEAIAADMQNVVKARYDDATWATVGKPLNDAIREASKEALIAYILANASSWSLMAPDGGGALLTTSDQLYEFFLIDVDMGTCMLTSRIVQAAAAVQLFVQRCLLNLESLVSPSAIDPTHWSWMQNFRVWQANRQVFLYPENWMVPTLRDDKTPFFADLEDALLQNVITNDSVTQLYLDYLYALNDVARMDMRACFWQYDSSASPAPDETPDATNDVLHVFGRTAAQPYKYYYRRLLHFSQYGTAGGAAIWTPWELVDLDIEGDHLVPVVWDGRLYLFWPHLTLTTSTDNVPNLQVSIYWSEYRQGAWTAKLASPPFTKTGWGAAGDGSVLDASSLYFTSVAGSDDSLTIEMWVDIAYWQLSWLAGYFTFSQCGGVPFAQATEFDNLWEYIIPDDSAFSDGQLAEQSANGFSVEVGDTLSGTLEALPTRVLTSAPIRVLANTPTAYDVTFPQQFYASFGLLVPAPYSSTDSGEPFFYQDSQRTYFVTDTVPWLHSFVDVTGSVRGPIGIFGSSGKPPVGALGQIFAAAAFSPSGATASTPTTTAPVLGRAIAQGAGTSAAPVPTTARRGLKSGDPLVQKSTTVSQIEFSTFFHPHVCAFIKTINRYGLPALLTLANQQLTNDGAKTVFETVYRPNKAIVPPPTFPHENVDFSIPGAYSIYNWELFFHIPLLIATTLSQNQQFADAQKWFHYIFNPTTSSTAPIPQRYWNCLPFYKCSPGDTLAGQIQNLMTQTSGASSAQPSECGSDIADQIQAWANDPFDPFVIGRMRTVAFRMNVVMAYLDNLIAWGDNLFAQNTRESINEATQIYVLAKEILGPRPTQSPSRGVVQDYTYNDLVNLYGLDSFSNAMVLMENDFPYLTASTAAAGTGLGPALSMSTAVPYFCYPPNDMLMGYWDTVDDRLYKIRHCMNIQGQVEQLPLFAPPISPALLVAAAAEGIDLASVISNVNSGVGFYRFSFMIQKALELCGEVRSFGGALLAALQKQDDETLVLLHANQELSLLQAMQQMKADALSEAQASLDGLNASLTVATDRLNFYAGLLSGGNNASENNQVSQLNQQSAEHEKAGIAQMTGSIGGAVPNFNIPGVSFSLGGQQLAAVANAVGTYFNTNAAVQSVSGSLAAVQGQWARRTQEWTFQKQSASDEITQIKAQISAATYRVAMAQDDQSNLVLQIANAQAVHDFLTGKYTNKQLYGWMVDQTSTVYFQCYQMAYELATRAEACLRLERGLAASNYIQFGYWDSLKKGLMAGEKLYADLKRMELAYLQTDVREFEITKAISLVLLDPFALISLKTNGQCIVNLPEAFFDQDYPGHYLRRVKTVSLTIPCVTGPYTSVNCTLTLLNSKIRIDSTAASQTDFASDAHFITNYAATQSIATSTAQNDAGMFEVNFRDERYLPFEGAGAISTWQLDLPIDCNAFDLDTITDVVINLRYTARFGGDGLRSFAKQAAVLPARPAQPFTGSTPASVGQTALQRMFSLRHEFPTEWYKFLNPPDAATSQSMSIALGNDRFPFQYRGRTIKITQVELVLLSADQSALSNYQPLALQLIAPSVPPKQSTITLNSGGILAGAPYGSLKQPPPPASSPPSWTLLLDDTTLAGMKAPFVNGVPSGGTTMHLNPDAIDDILMICTYSAT
jgi:GH18 family chitinase